MLGEAYKQEYDNARTSAQKRALASKLLQQAEKAKAGSTEHYVLLKVARDVATRASDAAIAASVVDRMSGSYTIDVLAMKTETLDSTVDVRVICLTGNSVEGRYGNLWPVVGLDTTPSR